MHALQIMHRENLRQQARQTNISIGYSRGVGVGVWPLQASHRDVPLGGSTGVWPAANRESPPFERTWPWPTRSHVPGLQYVDLRALTRRFSKTRKQGCVALAEAAGPGLSTARSPPPPVSFWGDFSHFEKTWSWCCRAAQICTPHIGEDPLAIKIKALNDSHVNQSNMRLV